MLLSLDTTSRQSSAALFRDGALLLQASSDSQHASASGGAAEATVVLIESLCRDAGAAVGDIGTVAVAIGPGSYTGIRSGIATAQGLAAALGCSVVGVSTLFARALPHLASEAVTAAAMPAAADEVYYALFSSKGEIVEALSAVSAGPRADLETLVREASGRPTEACAVLDLGVLDGQGAGEASAVLVGRAVLAEERLQGPFRNEHLVRPAQPELLYALYVKGVAAKTVEERRAASR